MMPCKEMPNGILHGCLKRTSKCGDGTFPVVFSDVHKSIPESDWGDLLGKITVRPQVKKVKSQGGEGSCASNMAASTYEMVRQIAGLPFMEFSAMSLYKRVGSSAMSGSGIDENLRAIAKDGILPITGTEGFEHTHPARGFRLSLPKGWRDTAKAFKLVEWMDIPDFASFVTALLKGFPVAYGVTWGRGGHAITGTEVIRPARAFEIEFLNSWGKSWGDKGFGTMGRSQVTAGIKRFGAWAARVPLMGDSLPEKKASSRVIEIPDVKFVSASPVEGHEQSTSVGLVEKGEPNALDDSVACDCGGDDAAADAK